jgi:hypothetical protein
MNTFETREEHHHSLYCEVIARAAEEDRMNEQNKEKAKSLTRKFIEDLRALGYPIVNVNYRNSGQLREVAAGLPDEDKILELVKAAMLKQDTLTYSGESSSPEGEAFAKETVEKIFDCFINPKRN